MKSLSFLLALSLSITAGCSGSEPSVLSFEEGGMASIGKADHNELDFTELRVHIGNDRLTKGGKAIITSAASWEKYMGSDAPAEVDFDTEWVAFFGGGMLMTGGYSAEITGLRNVPSFGALVVETLFQSPGFDCMVTQAPTTPHMLVKFDIPADVPTWATSDDKNETYRCSPTNEERLQELSDSFDLFETFVMESGANYNYERVSSSFFADSERATKFFIESNEIVARKFSSRFQDETTHWYEEGDELGTHEDGHEMVLADALYETCRNDVLTQSEDDNFINLSFDSIGLLTSCTYQPLHCADDCTRGIQSLNISFE